MHNKKINDVYKLLSSSENGLSNEEASQRLKEKGMNKIVSEKQKSVVSIFFSQFKSFMIVVLLFSAVISAILAVVQKDYSGFIDVAVILLIVVLNAMIGTIQEEKSNNALKELKKNNVLTAKVMRDGKVQTISVENIVVGDVILLEAGDIVPADIRLVSSHSLKVKETSLTGESVPIEKDATATLKKNVPLGDKVNMAFSGGVVCYGRAKGICVATGIQTEIGKIANLLNKSENEETPLQKQITKTTKILTVAILIIATIIFLVGILKRDSSLSMSRVVIDNLMIAIAIAVAAIPEGMLVIVTIALANGVKRMSEKKAIVKNLPAVETLGSCEVICSDKTGTLTQNKMTVKKVYSTCDGMFDAGKFNNKSNKQIILNIALCNDTRKVNNLYSGDPTEIALANMLDNLGEDFENISNRYERVDEIPFDSQRKLMTTVCSVDGKHVANTKGAFDVLINKCDRILDRNGVRKITKDDLIMIEKANKKMTNSALRVLALAFKEIKETDKNYEEKLVFIGLVGMIDPPRVEVFDAIRTCELAGLKTIMITGDHLDTAKAIAKQIGILKRGDIAITGVQLDAMSEKEFLNKLHKIKVYARVSPENKVRIVNAYKSINKIVAMTGDGVNDAPAVKSADIGVGMGITGTDVCSESADIVLADDNFATIVVAVEEGRKIYNNIKKSIQFLLSANIAEVLCLCLVTIFFKAQFLSPLLILWINLITDSLPALAIGLDRSQDDVMHKPPRKNNSSLFAGRTGVNAIAQGVLQTLLVLASFSIGLHFFNNHVAISMSYLTLVVIQLLHIFNCKSDNKSIFKTNLVNNSFLNISFLISIILGVLVFIPPISSIFDLQAISLNQSLIAIFCAILIIPLVEIQKFICNLKKSKK